MRIEEVRRVERITVMSSSSELTWMCGPPLVLSFLTSCLQESAAICGLQESRSINTGSWCRRVFHQLIAVGCQY